ncbi:hypothetical protein SDC9_168813 [bioreactor metagenome]|uniref:Uncharacterized protein n=1 Tax=bioreactor metagenome TaxID=1076179 RepID=A0A645GBK8_9ZZZZ
MDGEHSFVAYFSVVDGRNDIAALAVVDDVEVQNQFSVVAVRHLRVLFRRKFASRVPDSHPVGFRQGCGGEHQHKQHRYARQQSEPVLSSHVLPPFVEYAFRPSLKQNTADC